MRLEEEEEGTRKMRRTRGKPLIIACDAESITHPELLECIDIIEDPSARDIGMIYNDWSKNPVSTHGGVQATCTITLIW